MHRTAFWCSPKRLGAMVVVSAMLTQSIGPALAYSSASPGYAGTMSQLPGVYTLPPDPNVMFTLDDSASMVSEAVPDFLNDTVGMPTGQTGQALAAYRAQFPGMWVAMKDDETFTTSAYLNPTYYKSTNAIARYLRSSAGNPLYYDRNVTYSPWPTAANDKNANPVANVNAVNIHPVDPFNTARQIDISLQRPAGCVPGDSEDTCYWRATYYVYKGTTPLPLATPNTPLNIASNFDKIEIRPDVTTYYRASTRTDCGTTSCSYAQELQNFANWLQYYRTRMLMAKGGVAAAFAKQGTNLRLGYTTINTVGAMKQGVATFAGARRTSFYTDLYASNWSWSGTPLRRAMDDVGKYFQRSDIGNPWAEDPTSTTTVGTEYTCRKSFHILSTDGFWNGAGASSPANNNNDSFSGSTPAKPDGTTYSYSDTLTSTTDPLVGRFTINPFSDANSDTLADVAAYYWKTDLRTDLANKVMPSSRDPAFWQHLTTFTVGLGVSGTGTVTKTSDGSFADLSTDTARDSLVTNKTQLTWTTPSANDPKTGDDLIHAAMNGRGRYFSATNPTEMAKGLISALSEVTDQALDQAGLAVDGPQVIAGNKVYQGTFSPSKWYGRLYAFKQDNPAIPVNNKPTNPPYTNPDQVWEASNKMPAPTARNIFTYSGTAGTSFTWASLTSAQKGYLNNDSTLLDYLRGSAADEQANGGAFRTRSRYTVGTVTGGVLGDVVNGSPVKGPDAGGGYDRLPASDPAKAAYTSFRSGTALDNMRNTMFLGANDGMLHAFNLADGVERFAYVPNAVYNVPRATSSGAVAEQRLQMLSEPTYTHRFTVDGPPNVADAYIGSAWKTVLVGSNGAGARGIFAMNVTDPVVGGGATQFGTGKIMWEFTENNNTDMGFVLGYPHIVRMRSATSPATWAAIFGNGYDSASGKAKLFILNLETGAVIKEFAVGTAGDNGLSQPNIVVNANREAVAIYAGDLKGNMWKFDVDDTDPNKWKPAFGTSPTYTPLFTTATGQPISVMPELTAHTDPAKGMMVTFGTGKLFETSDTAATGNVNLNTQALYGVWDKPGESGGLTVSQLHQQTVNSTLTPPAGYGATSNTVPDWAGGKRGWYYNLGSGGERVNLPAQFVAPKNLLFMVANKPLVDPCSNGGTARVFALHPVTGAAPNWAIFNADGVAGFGAGDVGINVRLITTGVLTQPVFKFSDRPTNLAPTGLTTGPWNLIDVGQATSARQGVVERDLTYAKQTAPTPGPDGCGGGDTMVAAVSDTTLLQEGLGCGNGNTSPPPGSGAKPRISWRQLK